MKIYFCGSIRAGRGDSDLYMRLIQKLSKFGTVLTEHVGWKDPDPEVTKSCGDGDSPADIESRIYQRDMTWLNEADVVVAECTQPSLGVGYEVGSATALNKRILCLYRPADAKCKLSCMIRGAEGPSTRLIVKDYAEEGVDPIFEEFFATSKN